MFRLSRQESPRKTVTEQAVADLCWSAGLANVVDIRCRG